MKNHLFSFKLVTLFLIMLLVCETTPCTKGCLKCNTSGDACLICDSNLLFNLNETGVCEKQELDNCLISSHKLNQAECVQCIEGMIWDTTAKKCIEAPVNVQITGCRLYNQVSECAQCESQFYFKNGICNEALIEVEHCLEFSDKSYCSVCEGARKFNPDNGKCEQIELVSNCMGHIDYRCDECLEGYYLNNNTMMDVSLYDPILKTVSDFVQNVNIRQDFRGYYRENPFPMCSKSSFSNCLTYLFSDGKITGCDTCIAGHLKNSSGSCDPYPDPVIANCFSYSNGTTCSKCDTQYYLSSLLSNNECTQAAEVVSCEEYALAADECSKCLATHFLETPSTCTARTHASILNCDTLSTTEDLCSACETNFRATDDNLACLAKIDKCSVYDASTSATAALVCTTCDNSYYPDSTGAQCLLQDVPGCLNHESNKNSCDTCKSDYYKVGTASPFTCSKKNVSNCATYLAGDENKCSVCNNKFVLAADGTCDPMTDTNCYENQTNSETCLKCNNGYYLNGGACTLSTLTYDPLCQSTTDTDGECGECINGYLVYTVLNYLQNLPSNCASADGTGACTQCDVDKDGTAAAGADPATCAAAANVTGKCSQLKANTFEALGDNDGSCGTCRDSVLHYLDSDTCTERPFHNKLNCSTVQKSAADCQVCSQGTSPQVINEKKSVCGPDDSTFTALSSCLIHDLFDTSKCLLCNPDKLLTAGSCGDITYTPDISNHYYYDPEEHKVDSQVDMIGTPKANCEKYSFDFSNTSTVKCVQCASGNILQGSTANNYYFMNNSNGIAAVTQKYGTECVLITDLTWIKVASGDTSTAVANCASVISAGTAVSTDVRCLSCAYGYVPLFKTFEFDSAGTGITAISSIASCDAASTFGLSTTNKTQVNSTVMDGTFNTVFIDEIFDTCSDAAKSPLYSIKTTNRTIITAGVQGSEIQSVQCVEMVTTDKIDNCVAHGANIEGIALDLSGLTDVRCLACAPGFSLNSDFMGCTEIENCDTSNAASNTINSACQTCAEGFAYEISSTNNNGTGMDKCIEIPKKIENCLLTNSTECVLCKSGYTMDYESGECTAVSSTCASKGFPHSKLSTVDFTENNTIIISSSLFINYWFKSELQNGPLPCNTCGSGNSLYSTTSSNDSKEVCFDHQYNESPVEGCLIYNGLISEKCSVCKSEFVLDLDTKECVRRSENTNYLKCEQLVSHASEECKICKRGYLPDDDGVCVDNHHCLDSPESYDSSTGCSLCEEGYRPSQSDKPTCERIDSSDFACIQKSAGDMCSKCRDCRKTPINRIVGSYTETFCVFNQGSYDYSKHRMSIASSGSPTHKLEINPLSAIPSGQYLKTDFPAGSAYAKNVCIRGPTDPNCLTWDSSNKYHCTSCVAGYYPNTMFQRCFKGSIEGCTSYSQSPNTEECTACDNIPSEKNNYRPYYRFGTTCIRHTKTNCKNYDATANSCSSCKNGYSLDGGTACVGSGDGLNCKWFNSDQNTCSTCNSGYYNDSGECFPYTVENCKSFHSDRDECTSCIDKYYLSSISCLLNTAPNCLTISQSSNSCATCPADGKNYYSYGDLGCLEHVAIDNCSTYHSTQKDKCSSCEDGYYLDNGLCLVNPTGVKNCAVYTDPSTCFSCADGFFIENNVCSTVTTSITGCVVYAADGVCSQCEAGKMMPEGGASCDTPNETSCATWTDTDNCATCVGNTYLIADADSKIICKPTNIAHCLSAQNQSDLPVCLTCGQGFILREGKCDAPKVTILNCEVYDVETEECNSCFNGFLLSSKKDKCESLSTNKDNFCVKAHRLTDDALDCNLCKWGYMKNEENECVECGGEGCLICDSADSTKCALCQSTYYMTSTQSCSLNDPDDDNTVQIKGVMMMIMLVLLLIKPDN